MAQRNKKDKIALKVVTEVYGDGSKDYASRTISNITPTLTDADAREVGVRLAGLQAHTLDSVSRTITYEIVSDS